MRWLGVLVAFWPSFSEAGAWARGDGQIYVSASVEAGADALGLGTYAEYGLTERITLGFDGFTDIENESLTAIAFARYSFPTDGAHVWALGIGLGAEYRVDSREQRFVLGGPIFTVDHDRLGALARLSGHYGRGLERGWIAVDATYDFGTLQSRPDPPLPDVEISRAKLDLTYGHRLSERTTLMGKLHLFSDGETTSADIAIGATRTIWGADVEVGLIQSADGGSGTRLKLGLARSF